MITMSHKDRTHVSLTETEHDNRSAFLVWHAPNQYYKISIENGSVKHSHNYRRTDGHKFYVYVWYGTPFYVLCFIQSIIITSSISYFYMVQVPILKECYVMTWIIFLKNKWPFWDSKYVKVNKFAWFHCSLYHFISSKSKISSCLTLRWENAQGQKSTSLCVIMFFISSPNDIGYSGITENIFSI